MPAGWTRAAPRGSRQSFIPAFVDGLVKDGTADVRVLDTDSQWIGVTYQADKPGVQSALAALHRDGVYPPLR